MEVKLSEPRQICLQDLSKEELTEVMVELIRTDGRLRSVIMDVACSSPNIVTQF